MVRWPKEVDLLEFIRARVRHVQNLRDRARVGLQETQNFALGITLEGEAANQVRRKTKNEKLETPGGRHGH